MQKHYYYSFKKRGGREWISLIDFYYTSLQWNIIQLKIKTQLQINWYGKFKNAMKGEKKAIYRTEYKYSICVKKMYMKAGRGGSRL